MELPSTVSPPASYIFPHAHPTDLIWCFHLPSSIHRHNTPLDSRSQSDPLLQESQPRMNCSNHIQFYLWEISHFTLIFIPIVYLTT